MRGILVLHLLEFQVYIVSSQWSVLLELSRVTIHDPMNESKISSIGKYPINHDDKKFMYYMRVSVICLLKVSFCFVHEFVLVRHIVMSMRKKKSRHPSEFFEDTNFRFVFSETFL